jgi:predicted GNAT superfamily acetyltransferase
VSDIVIRPLEGLEERRECLRLQQAIWGDGFTDRVPPSILMIAQKTGGIASGAFLDDRLVGFVFGISGVRGGRLVHWSDMLAVLPGFRDRGLGMRLKRHQRDVLLGSGIETVLWTFDPLVARNAYLNLRRLGALVRTYERDLYGRSDSPLHAVIGTDRLLAEWPIASDRVGARLDRASPAPPPAPTGRLLNPPAQEGSPPRPGDGLEEPDGPVVEVAVPTDIEAIQTREPALALAWRHNVRTAFESALAAGYVATDLVRGERVARYVLSRTPAE